MERAYEEIVNFMAGGTTPGKIIAFQASDEAKERVFELISRKKTTGLSTEENAELERYMQLEHLMRLVKARAKRHLLD